MKLNYLSDSAAIDTSEQCAIRALESVYGFCPIIDEDTDVVYTPADHEGCWRLRDELEENGTP